MKALLVVILLGGLAYAQPAKKRATELLAEGQKLYGAGDFALAGGKFDAAYKLDADPVYLFNSAQAYRLGKQCATAVERYRKFIDVAPTYENMAQVKTYLAQAEDCAKKQAAESQPKEPPPLPPKPEPKPEAKPEPIVEQPRQVEPEREPESHRGRRITAIAIGGAGVVALAVGVYYTSRVSSLQSDREGVCGDPCVWTPEIDAEAKRIEDDGERAEKLAVGAYVVGGLAIAGGVALYMFSRDSANRDVAIAPTLNGAAVVGRF